MPLRLPNTQLPPTRSDASMQSNGTSCSCSALATAMPEEPAPMRQTVGRGAGMATSVQKMTPASSFSRNVGTVTLVFSSMRRLVPLLIAATALAAPAGAQAAGWGSGAPAGHPGRYTSSQGLAIQTGDRPAVLTQTYDRHAARRSGLLLHRAGRPTRTVATSRTSFEGAGLAAGPHGELIAAWLEIVGGSRRPVVATGPTLADRQVLAPGPRSTQYLSFAADARGDAVVAFWRYEGTQFAVWASYRPAGGRFSAAQRLATGDVDNPHVAIEDDGSASVVFGDEHGVRVADHAPAATAFTAPQALPGAARPTTDAAVARSGGRTTIAWVGTTAGGGAPSVLVSDRPSTGAA